MLQYILEHLSMAVRQICDKAEETKEIMIALHSPTI